MDTWQGMILFLIAVFCLCLSYFQFQERGFLFNNAYIWASKKERENMDRTKELKSPHYRQSATVFLLFGIAFIFDSLYIFLDQKWMNIIFWILMCITLIYAVVSSIKMALHK